MKYAFILQHRKLWPVAAQCRVLEVSASGYRQYRARQTDIGPLQPGRRLGDVALLVPHQGGLQRDEERLWLANLHSGWLLSLVAFSDDHSLARPVLCSNRHHGLTGITISPRMFMLCSRWRGSHVPAFPHVGGGAVVQHRQSMRMSDQGAENVFARLRWPTTDGKPVCPDCGCATCYDCRRGAYPRWRCKACGCDFSVTSGTLFAWRKLPLKTYLLSIVVFCNEVKGKSMLALSRDLGVQYKTAFVLAHKLREAMASALRGLTIGGEGKVAEIDGAYFGGHVRPENLAADRIDRRLAENQSGKRRVVVVMRERDGRTLPQVFASEDAAAVSFIRARIAKGTVVHADESPAWNSLHAKFSMKRVNHQEGYSIDDACTNGAESFFSRMRRGELEHHHHIAGVYFVRGSCRVSG